MRVQNPDIISKKNGDFSDLLDMTYKEKSKGNWSNGCILNNRISEIRFLFFMM